MKKRLFGLVVLILVLSMSFTMAAMAQVVTISLTPEEDQNVIGMSHTATATVLEDGNPVQGATVHFEVIDGPNIGDNSTEVTDEFGEAPFTYIGDGGCGVDTIEAEIIGVGPTATATKLWLYDKFSGGGKIIQENSGKKNTWPKITWGGWAGDNCTGPIGSFEVTFHNVAGTDLDGAKFVTDTNGDGITDISDNFSWLIFLDHTGCPDADPPESDANFVWLNVEGSLVYPDGSVDENDWYLGIRATDNSEPGNMDNAKKGATVSTDSIAFALWNSDVGFVYDSWWSGDFTPDQESPCFGIRHELDGGNLQIVWYD